MKNSKRHVHYWIQPIYLRLNIIHVYDIKSERRAVENYEKITNLYYDILMITNQFKKNRFQKLIVSNNLKGNSATRPRANCPSLGLNHIPLHALRYHVKIWTHPLPIGRVHAVMWLILWEWTCCKIMHSTCLHNYFTVFMYIEWAKI